MDWLSPIRDLLGLILPFFEHFTVIRVILGFVLVFFLPGFAWTLVFFRELDVIERATLSLALSIVVVTLSILLVSRVGMKITGLNSALVIIIITILPVSVYFLNNRIRQRRGSAD